MPVETHVADEDEQLQEAILTYLKAADGGRPISQQELLNRYPDLTAELTAFFADQSQLEPVLSPLRGIRESIPPRTLGDFQILREVGRGGMGVVYEAEQISLGRRVALKVLPFAATMDSRQLQRFQNEARAAASLEHPHIVPVYGVGCERGVHYYAMKFIDGQSLAEVIAGRNDESRMTNDERTTNDESRKPVPEGAAGTQVRHSTLGILSSLGIRDSSFFRTVAQLGIEAAEALEHAHSLGIVHRDIKPANLMIDGHGALWVTDFGLARTAADAGLTMAGDVLGTLRYMSPEQALAKHGLVDHRTDVYSLGVTLYELLTGKLAAEGQDREEILNAITRDEPRPLRVLDASIPWDLETIVLKAVAKEPMERYATARDLAEDLRRLLEDRPIQARRPAFGARLGKWTKRHRALVRIAGAALVLITSLAVTAFALIWRAYDREAGALLSEAKQHREADAKRRQARAAVDKMYTRVADKWLEGEPGLERLQREFLEEALQFYREFTREDGTDASVRQETANAYARVGKILSALGNRKDAVEAYDQAIAILEPLVAEHADVSEYANDLAGCYHGLAFVQGWLGDKRGAETNERGAIGIWERLVRDSANAPTYRRRLAGAYNGLFRFFSTDPAHHEELENALLHAQEVLEGLVAEHQKSAEDHRSLGGTLSNRAMLKLHQRKPADARLLLERAIVEQKTALGLNSRDKLARIFLRNHYAALAKALAAQGELPKALAAAEEGLSTAQELTRQSPDVPQYQGMLADSHRAKGEILSAMGKSHEAAQAYYNAITVLEAMPANSFSVHDRDLLNFVRISLGRLHYEQGEELEAVALYEKVLQLNRADGSAANNLALVLASASDLSLRDPARALALAKQAACQMPKNPAVQATLGQAYYRNGDFKAARETLEKSCELAGGTFGPAAFFLAMTEWKTNNPESAQKWFERATEHVKRQRPTREMNLMRAEAAALLKIEEKPNRKPE
jgi:serine/threonine protein kinase/Flp pilus assembly protein TadD